VSRSHISDVEVFEVGQTQIIDFEVFEVRRTQIIDLEVFKVGRAQINDFESANEPDEVVILTLNSKLRVTPLQLKIKVE
jgi:hypothetical protein